MPGSLSKSSKPSATSLAKTESDSVSPLGIPGKEWEWRARNRLSATSSFRPKRGSLTSPTFTPPNLLFSDSVESNDFLRKILGNKVFIATGWYTPQIAAETTSKNCGLIAFGRHHIANPDLPLRIKYGVPLARYQRSTFYSVEDPHGYTNYPAATLFQLDRANAAATPSTGETASPTTLVPAA